jgi:ribosomal protein S18 acetylase RimI-like enzyme
MQSLDGVALLCGGELAGYAYSVSEAEKGIIGDLFVRDAYRDPAAEQALLDGVLAGIVRAPGVSRVEAQLMLQANRPAAASGPAGAPVVFPRQFLCAPLSRALALPAKRSAPVLCEPWRMAWLDDASELIAAAYAGHIDSQINDQYRTASGARRFLQNIVQYPGCGHFLAQSSWIALDPAQRGRLAGVCLASRVAPRAGHITQLCVAPHLAGMGAGYELLRRALASLAAEGCSEVSLTVTTANRSALSLYERLGFETLHHFHAAVWEGFRAA